MAPVPVHSAAALTARPVAAASAPTKQQIGTVLSALVFKSADWVSGLPAGPVKELLAGALLLTQRALANAGYPGGGVGPGDGQQGGGAGIVGDTRLEIRNEADANFVLWDRSEDPQDMSKWVQKMYMLIGSRWSGQVGIVGDDHSMVITEAGVPKMGIVAENAYGGAPFVTIYYTDANGKALAESASPDRGHADVLIDKAAGLAVWVWRGPDIDSGSIFQANTKNFVVSIWEVPTREQKLR